MHVLTYFCRTNVFGILTIWQGVGIVVPVYCKKSRIYVLFGAPNLYLVQLAEILRCSGRDWLRPGGAARAGALLVRPSLRRAPLGWSVAAADAPRCSWPRRCFPARQPSPWFPAGGCRRPPARCGGVGVIVGRLLLLAMPLRRHQDPKRSRAAVQGGIFAFWCDFCAFWQEKRRIFADFSPENGA